MKQKSRTQQSANKTVYAALKLLKENGGHMRWSHIVRELENKLDFTEWELEITKDNFPRWTKLLSFYSIALTKSGLINKLKGEWFLTVEGEKSIKTLSSEQLLDQIASKYSEWQKTKIFTPINEAENLAEDIDQNLNLEQLQSGAQDAIMLHLKSKTPYEFQNIVAALLRAMGYYTPFIAKKGRDGGVDIIAYQDPLGAQIPKIKVQVKHYDKDNKIPVADIRGLAGLLHKENEIGLFVTSGYFSNEAERSARESHVHIELIDFTKLIELWTQFYSKLTDEDKNMLPLQPIYFLGTNE